MKKIPGITAPAGTRGQSFVYVMVLSATLAVMGLALVSLFRYHMKSIVRANCIIQKQELASIGLEQTIYKMQQGNWDLVGQGPMLPFNSYQHEFKSETGNFCVHVDKGNLFITLNGDTSTNKRQSPDDFRTIGIKVKTLPSKCTGAFYAVVHKVKFGGPLVSKGLIDLPCTSGMQYSSNFYWGNIYSSNPASGACRIPIIAEGYGLLGLREGWQPEVYAAGDIYTKTSGDYSTPVFGFTYTDMSPTAHCHPFSEYAVAPDIDLDFYKGLAISQGSYYGPGGITLTAVTNANAVTIMAKLLTPSSVLYIDTWDGQPVMAGASCNTYCNTTYASSNTATAGTKANTIKFYKDAQNQYMTEGICIIKGPLILIGDNPSTISTAGKAGWTWSYSALTGDDADKIMNVAAPNNYYAPQATSPAAHYYRDQMNDANSYLSNVKHYGLIYVDGELRIGGARTGTSPGYSDVLIYGTIYLGTNGRLSIEPSTSVDRPKLGVLYNDDMNLFSMTGSTVRIDSFNELTYLIPMPSGTPVSLDYPSF